ncbi:hypothetical protein AKO1_009637 [Acrasis kona]|uniref:NADH dehydrogenase subunit 6 n=1 Tax=Acrasis kona TaxID=1008807 RepID=A0AAW2ZMW9_9EUKA
MPESFYYNNPHVQGSFKATDDVATNLPNKKLACAPSILDRKLSVICSIIIIIHMTYHVVMTSHHTIMIWVFSMYSVPFGILISSCCLLACGAGLLCGVIGLMSISKERKTSSVKLMILYLAFLIALMFVQLTLEACSIVIFHTELRYENIIQDDVVTNVSVKYSLIGVHILIYLIHIAFSAALYKRSRRKQVMTAII